MGGGLYTFNGKVVNGYGHCCESGCIKVMLSSVATSRSLAPPDQGDDESTKSPNRMRSDVEKEPLPRPLKVHFLVAVGNL